MISDPIIEIEPSSDRAYLLLFRLNSSPIIEIYDFIVTTDLSKLDLTEQIKNACTPRKVETWQALPRLQSDRGYPYASV